MRLRFSLIAVSWFVLLAGFAQGASAQVRVDVYVTPIPNAPFTGVIQVERSVVQADGSVVSWHTMRQIGRDSQGRIHNEGRQLLPVSSTQEPQVVRIHLYDPQTRISTLIYPKNRTFESMTVNRPPGTIPPALLDASPTAVSIPQSEFTKQEDLGNREIEGVPVHGVRDTQTIAEENGSGKQIVVTDEYWYSADLRINMVIKHDDPRTGSVTMTVGQVSRTEPDPAFLKIPEGYTPVGASRPQGK